jgi:hypothetical protein
VALKCVSCGGWNLGPQAQTRGYMFVDLEQEYDG